MSQTRFRKGATEDTLHEVECQEGGCALWVKSKEDVSNGDDPVEYKDTSHCGLIKK